jgi:hypothetical protein
MCQQWPTWQHKTSANQKQVKWWLWPWMFLSHILVFLDWISTFMMVVNCNFQRVRILVSQHVMLNRLILREWLYCASLSLLWSLKARNKHSFYSCLHKKWVLLLWHHQFHINLCVYIEFKYALTMVLWTSQFRHPWRAIVSWDMLMYVFSGFLQDHWKKQKIILNDVC